VDDIRVHGCLHAGIVRSTHAHARLVSVNLERARRHPSVAGCFAFADLSDILVPLPSAGLPPPALAARVRLSLIHS